ncbi:hypothetical protein EUTSA_v10009905mg [Eutrema salsugineum]|uniref:Uncharacterized protein n=1 Tax=Eutrema salsugineum TaxID=72664 RepID=V4KYL0_EUTSA|nr:uncharacterized protein LOC18993185 [Eutrema salsugineum]XP_024007743.1 uncharacterized protein LOC18993185 [Eutrema salsugineum]ESQ35097.1 hypothetical protein EUTSA_v10009905mg [Eutrema salsugineum]
MDTYNYIVVIFCIAVFGINLVFCCFTSFSILHSLMTETSEDFSDLRKNLIEPREVNPDEKVLIISVSSNQGFSDSIDDDDDDCGQDCSHDICAC